MRFDDLPEKLQTVVAFFLCSLILGLSGLWFGVFAVLGAHLAHLWGMG